MPPPKCDVLEASIVIINLLFKYQKTEHISTKESLRLCENFNNGIFQSLNSNIVLGIKKGIAIGSNVETSENLEYFKNTPRQNAFEIDFENSLNPNLNDVFNTRKRTDKFLSYSEQI